MPCCIDRLVAACAGVLVLSGCDDSASKQAAAPPAIRVHFTCDVSGRIEPCGCFTGQFGGLTRLGTLLSASKQQSLRVDVGDALAGGEDHEVIQYRHVLQAFAKLGFHAANAGRREAALPAATLTALAAESTVPMLSANLVDAKTGAPVLKPWLHAQVDGVTYGIIGIVDLKSLGDAGAGEGLRALDPASVLNQYLPEVKQGCDVLVLLAFASHERMTELAAQFFEFHLILGGDVPQPSQELVRENRSLILATTNEGRAVGRIEATLKDGRLEKPTHEIILMADSIPQDDAVQVFAKAYRDEVRRTHLAVDDPERHRPDAVPGVRSRATFVGSESCAGCHQEDFVAWQKSGHAHAFDALRMRDSDADPSCIGCHTIGFGSASGYRRAFEGSKLINVGCESCHGPGSVHVAQRASGDDPTFHFRPLGAGDCQTCHYGEFSRPFEWAEFWPAIQHGRKKPDRK